jgi:hypothetical protein
MLVGLPTAQAADTTLTLACKGTAIMTGGIGDFMTTAAGAAIGIVAADCFRLASWLRYNNRESADSSGGTISGC